MGHLHPAGGRRPAGRRMLPVHLHEVLLPWQKEEAAEEGGQDPSDGGQWQVWH